MNSFDNYMTPRDRLDDGDWETCMNETPSDGPQYDCRGERIYASDNDDCGKVRESEWGLQGCSRTHPLAIAFVASQAFEDLFDTPEAGMMHGTMFQKLYLPFLAGEKRGGCKR